MVSGHVNYLVYRLQDVNVVQLRLVEEEGAVKGLPGWAGEWNQREECESQGRVWCLRNLGLNRGTYKGEVVKSLQQHEDIRGEKNERTTGKESHKQQWTGIVKKEENRWSTISQQPEWQRTFNSCTLETSVCLCWSYNCEKNDSEQRPKSANHTLVSTTQEVQATKSVLST